MSISFDGASKRIILSSGTTTLDVVDLYSRWKDWVLSSDNSKWAEAFAPVGGDDIDLAAGTAVPLYAFLRNDWRVRPQEANHTLNVTGGVLLVDGGGDPFVNTLGAYIVRINYQQPVQAITVATGGSAAPSAEDVAEAVWNHADVVELGLTPAQALRLMAAVLAGEVDVTGAAISFHAAVAAGKVRVSATVNSSGERANVSRDATP